MSSMTVVKDADGFRLQFDEEIPEEERRFYLKVYPVVDLVSERKVHCTVCNVHIGTAPANESVIRMHPILKVTHCKKCHEFYNSGEFSKGEDGSELYCRWCGQGGEVYCCSKCPYVFCTNCIVQNLTKDCVNDIEENENWNCFVCAPKIMWHMRAQHWAMMNFIEKQKQNILDKNLTESSIRKLMTKDLTTCCKPKSGNISDSSCDSESSATRKRKALALAEKKPQLVPKKIAPKPEEATPSPEAKKTKVDDEVVCTPDVSCLVAQALAPLNKPSKPASPAPQNNGFREILPKVTPPTPQFFSGARQVQIQPAQPKPPAPTAAPTPAHTNANSSGLQITHSQPNVSIANSPTQAPPLAIRTYNNPALRGAAPAPLARKSIVGSRPPSATVGQSPVYHTINGFRIDLNTAAQHETFRLPNGKLIQVKRQGTAISTVNPQQNTPPPNPANIASQAQMNRPAQIAQVQQNRGSPGNHILNTQLQGGQPNSVQQFTIQQPSLATIRYAPATGQMVGAGGAPAPNTSTAQANVINHMMNGNPLATVAIRPAIQQPTIVKQIFASTPLGQARSQLQNQIFSSMEICQHLVGKIHTLTNSNAYKTARNYTDVKELYIHLSYLFTYAIGRFKTIQEKCMDDMRCLGFAGDAATLESGQLEKYASDNDEDDIVIVEPKTTLIDLDSDEEDTSRKTPQESKNATLPKSSAAKLPVAKPMPPLNQLPQQQRQPASSMCKNKQPPPLLIQRKDSSPLVIRPVAAQPQIPPPLQIQPSVMSPAMPPTMPPAMPAAMPPVMPPMQPILMPQLHPQPVQLQQQSPIMPVQIAPPAVPSPVPPLTPVEPMECDLDFTANLLAGMLDVELHEGTEAVQITTPPKKPRKKTTNKPNPHLIKQQELQAREREREQIKRDSKLNTKCLVTLERVDETNEDAKKLLEEYVDRNKDGESSLVEDVASGTEKPSVSPCPKSNDNEEDESQNSSASEAEKRSDEVCVEKENENKDDSEITEDQITAGEENNSGRKSAGLPKRQPETSEDTEKSSDIETNRKATAEPISLEEPKTSSSDVDGEAASDPKVANSVDLTKVSDNVVAEDKKEGETNMENKEQDVSSSNIELVKNAAEMLQDLVALVGSDDESEQIELLEVIDQPDDEMADMLGENEPLGSLETSESLPTEIANSKQNLNVDGITRETNTKPSVTTKKMNCSATIAAN